MKSQLTSNEGNKNTAYTDSKGNLTIGVGYELDGDNEVQARKDIQALGLDYNKVISGQLKLNPQQIGNLLDKSLERAKNNAQLNVASFNQQPKEIQEVLTEMTFQLGNNGFRKFENFIEAINNNDYKTAAKEIQVNSKGTGPSKLMIDTPNRAQNYVEKILKAKSSYTPTVKPTVIKSNPTISNKNDDGLVTEFFNSVSQNGFTNAATQVWNKVTSTNKIDNVVAPKEIIIDDKKENHPIIKEIPSTPKIKLLSDTIQDPSIKDRVYVAFSINADKNTFGIRNRGDYNEINTKAAVLHTYNKFRKPSDYIGINEPNYGNKNGLNTNNDDVIALNTKTGKIHTGKAKDFNNDYYISRTLPPKLIKDIKIDSSVTSNKNLAGKKQIQLITNTNKQIPGMIGFDNSGYEMGSGYAGGKILITTPDGKNTQIIYGSAQNLKKELNKFKSTYNTEYVKFYDLDGKAFSQALQTKDNKLKSDLLQTLDNTNSSGGSFLYLK